MPSFNPMMQDKRSIYKYEFKKLCVAVGIVQMWEIRFITLLQRFKHHTQFLVNVFYNVSPMIFNNSKLQIRMHLTKSSENELTPFLEIELVTLLLTVCPFSLL